MAHKTLIGGTAYEIKGGKTLVGGTAYSISKGRTLVGGTGYDISFSNLPNVGTALNNCTWEQIRAVSDAGEAANYFAVGDTKTIVINGKIGATTFSNLSIGVFIIGIDHNSTKEGTNRIHFQIGKISSKDVCLCDSNYGNTSTTSGEFAMNTSLSNSGGWSGCHMRTTVLGSDSNPISPTANTYLAALPSDLRAVMKSVTKYSDNTGGGSNTSSYVTATTDYLWLLAEFELHGERNSANSAEQNYQVQYAYYAAGNSKVKYKHNATSTAARWFLRSVDISKYYLFCDSSEKGLMSSSNARTSRGVSPAFCV